MQTLQALLSVFSWKPKASKCSANRVTRRSPSAKQQIRHATRSHPEASPPAKPKTESGPAGRNACCDKTCAVRGSKDLGKEG
jgi:hypothetical protein